MIKYCIPQTQCSVYPNFGGTRSFLNLVESVISRFWWILFKKTLADFNQLNKHYSHSQVSQSLSPAYIALPCMWIPEPQSFLNLVEHSHFSIYGNRVISQFSGTQSFFDLGEHSHFSIQWNTVISQFSGTQSFLNLMEHSHFSI